LANADASGTTTNNLMFIGGPTSTDNRIRFLSRTPTDLDLMNLRRTLCNINTPLDVAGNITQGNTYVISQTGISGNNTLRSTTITTNGNLTLQGSGSITYADGSRGRTFIYYPMSSLDIISYETFKPIP
jgi:hypothetical protein